MTDHTTNHRFRRILVPIDGSDASRAALDYAMNLPSEEIVLLHVAVDDEVIVPEWAHDWTESDNPASSVEAVLHELAVQLGTDDRPVHVETRIGDVAEEIIDAGHNADLIVMMTHGRGAAGRIIFGSVADRVVRHGTTPTLLLRMGDLTRAPVAPKRVVIALDGSSLAEQAIAQGEKFASACGLPILLVRAIGEEEVRHALRERRPAGVAPYQLPPTLYQDTKDDVSREARDYLEGIAATMRERGHAVETKTLDGTATFVIVWETSPEDVLVLATRGQGGFKRWSIGSVAEKLVREAKSPVLLQRVARGDA